MPRVAVKDAEGDGNKGTSRMLSFAAARAIVRKLKLKSRPEWREWRKSGQRPSNIPSSPHQVYRDDGWISLPDWLGYEGQARGKMLSFMLARVFARKLKLRSKREWQAWRETCMRPSNIPSNPQQVYRDDGWISMPDWLGYTGPARGKMLAFMVARVIARKLKLRSKREWQAWSKSGLRPSTIPSHPNTAYRDDGWISMPDWLGYGSAGGARAASRSSSNSSASTAPKKKKKKKRKRRPTTTHPSDLPPPPPPSTSPFKPYIKTEKAGPPDDISDTTTADDTLRLTATSLAAHNTQVR